MKLFRKTNFSSTVFYCSKCFNQCEKTRFNTKTCINENCSLFKRGLKTKEIVEIVSLDIRTQIKSISTRNANLLIQHNNFFPTSDVTSGSCTKQNSQLSTGIRFQLLCTLMVLL